MVKVSLMLTGDSGSNVSASELPVFALCHLAFVTLIQLQFRRPHKSDVTVRVHLLFFFEVVGYVN